MFGSAILDVVIGCIVVLLMASTIVSAVVEIIASYFGWRSTILTSGIVSLFDGENEKVDALLKHPLITSLSKEGQAKAQSGAEPKNATPSYIPAGMFSAALIDLIKPKSSDVAPVGSFAAIYELYLDHPEGVKAKAADEAFNPSQTSGVTQLLSGLIQEASRSVPDGTPEADTKRLQCLRTQIEKWFERTMERAAGWYKRQVQWSVLIVGGVLVAALNVDLLGIAQAMYRDANLRQAAGALATASTQPTLGAGKTPKDEGIGAAHGIERLVATNLPIGWGVKGGWTAASGCGTSLLLKILGLVSTMLAVSLGAPFWFDVLNKMVNLRSAGNKPESHAPLGNAGSDASDVTAGAGDTGTVVALAESAGGGTVQDGLPADFWSRDIRRGDFAAFQPRFAPEPAQSKKCSMANAAALAKLALLAYRTPETFERIAQEVWHLFTTRIIDEDGTQVFVAGAEDFILVAFRGTEPSQLEDIIADAKFALQPFDGYDACVHAGFKQALNCVMGKLMTAISEVTADIAKWRKIKAEVQVALLQECTDLVNRARTAAEAAVISGLDPRIKGEKIKAAELRAKQEGEAMVAKEVAARWRDEKDKPIDLGEVPAILGQAVPKIWVTGHSLGAALATLFATRIANEGIDHERLGGVYTFGSPRVGDRTFASLFAGDWKLGGITWRFVNSEDLVTRVAPRALGYEHVGNVAHLRADGTIDYDMQEWVRFLGTVINALENFKAASKTTVKDHSMELYVKKLDDLAQAAGGA